MVIKRLWRIVICISLFLSLSLSVIINASGPEDDLGQSRRQVIGVVSNALKCLAVGSDAPAPALAAINLTWPGQAERVRLVGDIAGTEAGHTIKVNGQPVAQTPIYPGGQACGDGEFVRINLPINVLVQGDNLIEITNDALASDNWTMADIRLEVFGDFTLTEADRAQQIGLAEDITIATTFVDTFTNSYDGTLQEFMYQVPGSYSGQSTPLLVAVHARAGTMEKGLNWFDQEADTKGWLLASAELHGRWPVPPECQVYPSAQSCHYDDRVLAGTTYSGGPPYPDPHPKPGYYAYASLESQYDVIGTVDHMVQNFNVDLNRIYLAGYSMGGQGTVVTAAKFPHLFAAIFDAKGPTDMVTWHDEQVAYEGSQNARPVRAMTKECHLGGVRKTPNEHPFCYERRSGLNFARNLIHVPISVTHSISDAVVPYHHSTDLAMAINSYGPDQTVTVIPEESHDPAIDGGPPSYHFFEPDPNDVLGFLDLYTLNSNPTYINIKTDESKSYYWLNIDQSGGEHWTEVEATYNPAAKTVTATISDSNQLTLGFNLGSTEPITDVIRLPAMGLPDNITYTVEEQGQSSYQQLYTSGYFTVTLNNTGRFTLTISAPSSGGGLINTYLPLIIKDN